MSTSLDGIGRNSSATHDQHFAIKGKRPRLACRSRYVCNRADSITHRVIYKGVGRIGKSASRDIAAPTRVDEGADGRRGYIAERNGQNRGLLHPGVGPGSKLPDLVGSVPPGNVESAQDVELVLEDGEAAGQNVSRALRPGSSNRADHVRDRIITEDATGSQRRSACRAAHAVDVGRSGVG